MTTTNLWPELPLADWKDTYYTLHMWTQIVGKIRLALTPLQNHWWNATLYITPRGLTTSTMTYKSRHLRIDFDFISHDLLIDTADGSSKTIALRPRSVADFYQEIMSAMTSLGIPVTIWTTPVEVPDRTPFDKDQKHAAYDPEYAQRIWRILAEASRVLTEFRSRFTGKVSPVHFFWGSFDLCVTRFSGRRAPERPGADSITREAYSHEVISAGFWPGTGDIDAVFYCYAAPEPPGFAKQVLAPSAAFYNSQLSEFFLKYDDVRRASSPRQAVLDFLHSGYDAGATLGKWDRESLERVPSKG